MNIEEASKTTELSAHTLRYYEKLGLIFDVRRNAAGHRDYSAENLRWIDLLKKLKSTGMTLANIKKYACMIKQGDSTFPERCKLLTKHKKIVESNLIELQSCLDVIDYKLKKYGHSKKS